MRIEIIGSGGKTTLMNALARYYQAKHMKVLMVTSTKMAAEERIFWQEENSVKGMLEELDSRGFLFAASHFQEKAGPLDPKVLEILEKAADIVLCEADGSKRLPLKYPKEGMEPAVSQKADLILLVCGLDGLHKPIDMSVHRFEEACVKFGWKKDQPVSTENVVFLLKTYLERLDQNNVIVCCSGKPERESDFQKIQKALEVPCVFLPGIHHSPDLCRTLEFDSLSRKIRRLTKNQQ